MKSNVTRSLITATESYVSLLEFVLKCNMLDNEDNKLLVIKIENEKEYIKKLEES